jgi:hypothetical protein
MPTLLTNGTAICTDDPPWSPDEAQVAAAAFLARYNGRTLEAYRHDLRYYFQWATDQHLAVLEASRAHIEIYRSTMEQRGLAASTIDRRLTTVCGYYRFAHIDGRIPANPAQYVRRPKVEPTFTPTALATPSPTGPRLQPSSSNVSQPSALHTRGTPTCALCTTKSSATPVSPVGAVAQQRRMACSRPSTSTPTASLCGSTRPSHHSPLPATSPSKNSASKRCCQPTKKPLRPSASLRPEFGPLRVKRHPPAVRDYTNTQSPGHRRTSKPPTGPTPPPRTFATTSVPTAQIRQT